MLKTFALLVLFAFAPFGKSDFTQRIPLTKEKVKNYIEIRVKTHDLQLKYLAKPDQYEDVIVAYYKARNEWLPSEGWTGEEFDATEEWIKGVVNSIDAQAELVLENAEREAQFAKFDSNEHLSDEQKQQMKDALMQSVVQREGYIDMFKEDWPAVKPYLQALEELDDYIGGSRATSPELE
jgi:small nuclear ribonucleoprotein (snRNP)-like protein